MNELVYFEWGVHKAGYCWHIENGNALLIRSSKAREVASFAPMRDEPSLYLKFAKLERTEESILGFANKYGRLGLEKTEKLKLENGTFTGETFQGWKNEIYNMSIALALKEALARRTREERHAELSRYIEWGKELPAGVAEPLHVREQRVKIAKFMEGVGIGATAIRLLHPGSLLGRLSGAEDFVSVTKLAPVNPGDLEKPARYFIGMLINRGLGNRVAPRLMWDTEHGAGRAVFKLLPSSLIGALWLQFAQSVSGSKGHRICECGEPFEIGGGLLAGARIDKQYCSDTCSKRVRRKRKREQEKRN